MGLKAPHREPLLMVKALYSSSPCNKYLLLEIMDPFEMVFPINQIPMGLVSFLYMT
jgi:hypothetical protein